MPTAVGSIDNLYLSPQGYLTIVETKLWRNPEARREVVGQIIDYAREVSRWSYDDLEARVRAYNQKYRNQNLGILDTLREREQIEETEEPVIVDRISRNLRRGRFLLLVVGDGIRESVEAMSEYLNQSPQLYFTLALVELQVYEWWDKSLMVVPQIVMRTQEVTRAVVRIEGREAESVRVDVASVDGGSRPLRNRFILSEEDYLSILRERRGPEYAEIARMILREMEGRGYLIDWKQGSYVVKWRGPEGSGQNLTLLIVNTDGKAYIGWLSQQLNAVGLPREIAFEFAERSAEIFGRRPDNKYRDSWDRYLTLTEVWPRFNEFAQVIQETVNKIESAAKETA